MASSSTAVQRPKLLDCWRPGGNPLVMIDTETTGNVSDDSRSDGHCCIQIALVVLDGNTLKELGARAWLVRPQRPKNANAFAMQVHGIPMHKLLAAPPTREVATEVEEFLLGPKYAMRTDPETRAKVGCYYQLSAHNLAFDRRFFGLFLERAGLGWDRYGATGICTQRMAQRLIKEGKLGAAGSSLDDLLRFFHDRDRGTAAHDALEDARHAAEVLRHMAELDQA